MDLELVDMSQPYKTKGVTEESHADMRFERNEGVLLRSTKGKQASEYHPSIVYLNEDRLEKIWCIYVGGICVGGIYEDGVEGRQVPHRDGGPAVTKCDIEGIYCQAWYSHGQLHREDGPASIHGSDRLEWYQHGLLHRVDGPAVCMRLESGIYYRWYIHGRLHREDGPALVHEDSQCWYKHGLLHREGGPAVVTPEEEKWYVDGILHRTDGPAYNGMGHEVWYINGKIVYTPP